MALNNFNVKVQYEYNEIEKLKTTFEETMNYILYSNNTVVPFLFLLEYHVINILC